MTKPYSMDFREKAIARIEAGGSARSAARGLGLSASTTINRAQRHRASGRVAPGKIGGHEGAAARAAIKAAGARMWFPPPFSADLNPIEQVFAKLKHLQRKAAERTVEATWRRIGSRLNHFTRQECANDPANSGYASA